MNIENCTKIGRRFLILCIFLSSISISLQAAPTCKDPDRKKAFADEAKLQHPYDSFYPDIVNYTVPKTFEKVTLITDPFPAQKKTLWNTMFECYYAHLITTDPEWEIISPINTDWIETLNECNNDFWTILAAAEAEYKKKGYPSAEFVRAKVSIVSNDIKLLEKIEREITAYLKKKLGTTPGSAPRMRDAGVNEQDWIIAYALSISLQMALGNLKKALNELIENPIIKP